MINKKAIENKEKSFSKKKGDTYEFYIKSSLLQNYSKVYLWSDIPLDTLIESKIFKCYSEKRLARIKCKKINSEKQNPIPDTGCDILYYNNEEWIIVQCKDHVSSITIQKLAGYFFMRELTNLRGEVYYTSNLSHNLTSGDLLKTKFIKLKYPKEISNTKQDKLVPYDYQIEAHNNIKNKKRSILQLPCGMGKTLTSIMWASNYDLIIIFSPLRDFAKQNLEKYESQLPNYETILIDSDGTRDINEIKQEFNKKLILSVTYKSADVIVNLLDIINSSYEKICVVIDEFHNLSKNNVLNKEDNLNRILIQDKFNYLFLSATPRVYELEDDDEYTENIIGKIEYKYDFRKAIDEGFICDYNIYVPDITINKDDYLKEIIYESKMQLSKFNDKDNSIKALYLLRSLDENGYSKCITFCKDINDVEAFSASLVNMNSYHCIDLKVGIITSKISANDRNRILQEFKEYQGRYIICSVHILDECIDMRECDSIFLNNNSKTKSRIIQRMCRSNRKNKNKLDKISGIFLWCSEYDETCDVISSLKEFDVGFTKEKVKIINYHKENNRCVIKRKKEKLEIVNYNQNNNESDIERIKEKTKYDNIDKFIIGVKKVMSWDEKRDLLFEYCEINKTIPIISIKYKDQHIGTWLQTQKSKINLSTDDIYVQLSFNKYVKDYLDEYLKNKIKIKKIILTEDEMQNLLFEYCNINKIVPIKSIKYQNQEIGLWFYNEMKKINLLQLDIYSDSIYKKLSINEYIKINLDEYIKNNKQHICDVCHYYTTKKSNYDEHVNSKDHVSKVNAINAMNTEKSILTEELKSKNSKILNIEKINIQLKKINTQLEKINTQSEKMVVEYKQKNIQLEKTVIEYKQKNIQSEKIVVEYEQKNINLIDKITEYKKREKESKKRDEESERRYSLLNDEFKSFLKKKSINYVNTFNK